MMHKCKLRVVTIDDKDIKNKSWANASFSSIKRGEVILQIPDSHVGYQFIGRLWRFEGGQGSVYLWRSQLYVGR